MRLYVFLLLSFLMLSHTAYNDAMAGELIDTSDSQQIDDMNSQASGQYPAMNLNFIKPLGMQQRAWTDPLQHLGEGQTKPGYSKYYWNPNLVLPIRLREGMITLMNFPEWELIEEVFFGDTVTFFGEIAAPNALLIFPKQPGADTNLMVFGRSGNRYVFYLRSETYNTERITHSIVDVIVEEGIGTRGGMGGTVSSGNGSFGRTSMGTGGVKPVTGLHTASTGDDDWMEKIPLDPTKFRFDLDIYVPNPEDAEIAPERVWRDDIFTYIDFGKKALSMTQRPVVNLLLQRSEVPVGFRTKGPHGRLIVVEGIGDFILRNGLRVVCIKQRREPSDGLEFATYDRSNYFPAPPPGWAAPPGATGRGYSGRKGSSAAYPYPWQGAMAKESNEMGVTHGMGAFSKTSGIPTTPAKDGYIPPDMFSSSSNISIELDSGPSIGKLERSWNALAEQHPDILSSFQPIYSVDTHPGAGGKETFRLRIGPIKDLLSGDTLCERLGRRGVSCSVVRTQ